MNFRLLYDTERRLLRVGYNATHRPGRRDSLRSAGIGGAPRELHRHREARRAGVALVRARAPDDASEGGHLTLLSWGGTMFEYLMSGLLMAVRRAPSWLAPAPSPSIAQMAYGSGCGQPWGTSESAYARRRCQPGVSVPLLRGARPRPRDGASRTITSSRPTLRSSPCRSAPCHGRQPRGAGGLGDARDLRDVRGPRLHPRARDGASGRGATFRHRALLHGAPPGDDPRRPRQLPESTARWSHGFHSNPVIETGEALLNECAPAAAPPRRSFRRARQRRARARARACRGRRLPGRARINRLRTRSS